MAIRACASARTAARPQQRPAAVAVRPARASVVVRAQQAQPSASRRQIAGAAAALLAGALYAAPPAHALFGLGGDPKAAAEEYTNDTAAVLQLVTGALALEKDAPDREERVAEVRKGINGWVAKYRRSEKFAGRPSYGNTYSVCNTLAGHYNSFGTKAPLPKKRLERLNKELEDASKLLERGR
ncbi:photosystem II repair protein, chloroplastic [Raphidocelis subcapitata]|uniref:Photosystem II repair protein, chloroplastic n=1 Tax=Raphidocelis subcapitata TaxID=307507 RepID=A0A2V0P5N6_9CHLO|nr:photosystem II repair protein, chloroplastic [Raphidocelis subcapitata]|eukprot:GBF95184.1 photosystem II repair protein, chloroplastic [Raphidocelis subcapitata]